MTIPLFAMVRARRESVTAYDDGRVSTTAYNAEGGMTGIVITDPLKAVTWQSLEQENVYSVEMQMVRNTASHGIQFILGATDDNMLTGGALDDLFKGQAANDIFFSRTVGNGHHPGLHRWQRRPQSDCLWLHRACRTSECRCKSGVVPDRLEPVPEAKP